MYEYSGALDAAKNLLNGLDDKSNLSSVVIDIDEADKLKLKLRFLIACLHVDTHERLSRTDQYRFIEVREGIKMLHELLIGWRKQWWWRNTLGCFSRRWDVTSSSQWPSASYMAEKVHFSVRSALISKEETIRKVSIQHGSDEGVVMIESLRNKLLKELPECFYTSEVVSSGIRDLETKLRCMTCLIHLGYHRSVEVHISVEQLLGVAQGVIKYVGYLAADPIITDDMNNAAMERKLFDDFSFFASKLCPNETKGSPNVAGMYGDVLYQLKLSKDVMVEWNSFCSYKIDETALDFLDSLSRRVVNSTKPTQLLDDLRVELESLRTFLGVKFGIFEDHKIVLSEFWKSNDNVLPHVEILLIQAGRIIYFWYQDDVHTWAPLWIAKLKVFNDVVRVREFWRQPSGPQPEMRNFPMTDGLGALDILLHNLEEELMMNNRVVASNLLLTLSSKRIPKDWGGSLRSILNTIAEQQRYAGKQKLEKLWRQIIHVVYATKYLVDLALVEHGDSDPNHAFLISDLIEEMEFIIKTEAGETQSSDNNDNGGVQEHRVAIEIYSAHGKPKSSTSEHDEQLVGYTDEKRKIVDQLLGESKRLEIASIVGMPGLGKTFLAHKVYNDPFIKSRFYIQAWCSISQQYERRKLLTDILSQVKEFNKEMSRKTDEELAAELKQSLLGQKYLIVLDDIWDIGAWDALRRSFPDSNKGSRILFTSRFSQLDAREDFPEKVHYLQSLSDDESWVLLQKKIFQTESCPLELVEVGQQIATRCNGLPLAIVVVAGLLARTVKTQEEWERVRDGVGSYIISDPQKRCRDILDLSYKSLPDHLKPCFLYLGAFPEDKEISVKKLSLLWIAEQFVRENSTNLENLAQDYLKELINRSLVIGSKKRSSGGVKTCRLHDLVREFCLSKAKEENFFMLIEGNGDVSKTQYDRYRVVVHDRQGNGSWYRDSDMSKTQYDGHRVFVHDKQGNESLSGWCGSFVRSLVLFNQEEERTLAPNEAISFADGFKLLKVLDLMEINLGTYFLESFKSLVLLRYLAVSGYFRSLPSSIAQLRRLETLIVGAAIENLSPDTILKMAKLRHLFIESFTFPQQWSIGSDFQQDYIQTISSVSLFDDNDLELIRRFPHLKKLSCVFRDSILPLKHCITSALEILTQLETLKVSYSGHKRFPGMFSLPRNVRKLTMSGFRLSWEEISIVGELPNLEVLKLLLDAFEGEEWKMEGEGVFPKLRFLKLKSLDIKSWVSFSDDYFPSIEHLVFDRCYELEDIPSCLKESNTLQMIRVYRCNDSLKKIIKEVEQEHRDLSDEVLKIEM